MSIATGAQVVVYDAPFTGPGNSFQALFNAAINGGSTVITNSFAYCEDQTTAADVSSIDSILQAAAASGISVFNASGDAGSTCLNGSPNTVAVPASSPSATAVGGTSLTLGPGSSYESEEFWDGTNDAPPTGEGGYGVSRYFSRPAYQDGLNPSSMRSVPDLVAQADPAVGVMICQASNGGCPNGRLYGGTSIAAPQWAGFTALLNQAVGQNLGAVNPRLYPLAGTDAFHDAASLGSDFARVGLGSPNLDIIFSQLTGQMPGLPSAARSQADGYAGQLGLAEAALQGIPADGVSKAYVVVRLADENGLFVTGKSVSVTPNAGSSVTIIPAAATTMVGRNAVVFTVTSTTPETTTFTVTDVTDGIVLDTQPVIDFVEPPATSGGIAAAPDTVAADGASPSTITVTLENGLGQGAVGKEVILDQGPGRSRITSPNPAVTDANGEIVFTVTNLFEETTTYTAVDVTDGNLPVPGSAEVTFINGSPQPCNIAEPVAGAGYVVSSFATSFPFGFFGGCQGAAGMAFDKEGKLYVADEADGHIYKLGTAGGAATEATRLTTTPYAIGDCIQGLAFSKDGEHLYLARQFCGSGGDVVEIDPMDGQFIRSLGAVPCATGIATDPVSGDLFVSSPCPPGGGTGDIYRISDPESAAPSVTVYSSPGHAQGLSFTPDGTLWASPLRFDLSPIQRDIVRIDGTNTVAPGTVAVLSSYVAPDPLVAATNVVPELNPADPGNPAALYVVNGDGGLNRMDLTQSPPALTPVASGGDAVVIMVGGSDGCLYFDDQDRIVRVTMADGTCGAVPSTVEPVLVLNPTSASPNPSLGEQQTLSARLVNLTVPEGTPVFFEIFGTNPQRRMGRTDAAGTATVEYTGIFPGTDTVFAVTPLDSDQLVSNAGRVVWEDGPHVNSLSLNTTPTSSIAGTTVTLETALFDTSEDPMAPIAGVQVQFMIGGQSCTGITDANGIAHCDVAVPNPGTYTLQVRFAGDLQQLPTSNERAFVVTADPGTPPVASCFNGALTGGGQAMACLYDEQPSCAFESAAFIPVSDIGTPPPQGVQILYDLFSFVAVGCGDSVTLSISYPSALPDDTGFWSYGPTPDQAPHWYSLPTTESGATLVTTLADGVTGDDDLVEDGRITKQAGGAGQGQPPAATRIPVLDNPWLLALLILILVAVALSAVWISPSRLES